MNAYSLLFRLLFPFQIYIDRISICWAVVIDCELWLIDWLIDWWRHLIVSECRDVVPKTFVWGAFVRYICKVSSVAVCERQMGKSGKQI